MASQLEDIERILQDISNHSNVKSLQVNVGQDTNTELQLEKHKNHLASLKTKLARLQTQSCFLENLSKEDWFSTDSMEITEYQANMMKERKEVKETTEKLETDLDDSAETLCTNHKVLKEKLDLLEQRLSSLKDKKSKYEFLKEKSQETAAREEQENKDVSFDELQAKQLEVDTVIEQCKTAISTLKHCKGLLQVEASHLQEKVYELQEHKNSNEALTQGHPPDQANQRWLAGAVQVLSKLGGIKVQSIEGDSVVLELENDAIPSTDQGANTTLILTIKFRLELSGDVCAVFAGAEVNLPSISIDDLVCQALHTGDVVGFILQVKRRFRNQRTLIEELEKLQTNYAMDWEPSHGRIRVMLGRSGKVVCTLKVDPVSTSRGDVQVVRVEGSSHQTEIERLQTDGSNRNLTRWIEDLQQLFSNE
ncbi:uncharacterized protein [Porites lutea]|uniref:uncharacterized protein n=1 Tax=Porites lutea TaxID=51062 RepID=UPI003CC6796B